MRYLLLIALLLMLPACYEGPEIPEDITITHEFSITVETLARALNIMLPISLFADDLPPEVLDDDLLFCGPTVCLTAGDVRDVRDFVQEFTVVQ